MLDMATVVMIVSILVENTAILLIPMSGRVRAADIMDAIILLAIAVLLCDNGDNNADDSTFAVVLITSLSNDGSPATVFDKARTDNCVNAACCMATNDFFWAAFIVQVEPSHSLTQLHLIIIMMMMMMMMIKYTLLHMVIVRLLMIIRPHNNQELVWYSYLCKCMFLYCSMGTLPLAMMSAR